MERFSYNACGVCGIRLIVVVRFKRKGYTRIRINFDCLVVNTVGSRSKRGFVFSTDRQYFLSRFKGFIINGNFFVRRFFSCYIAKKLG